MTEPLLPLIQARLFILEDADDVKRNMYGEVYDDTFPMNEIDDTTGEVENFQRRELVANCLFRKINSHSDLVSGDKINIEILQKCFKEYIEEYNEGDLFDDWEKWQINNFVVDVAHQIMDVR